MIYDEKTKGVMESNGQFILPNFNSCDNATFKASYVVASDIECSGTLTALFDLTVLGNINASEIDVNGRFICTGKCVVNGSLSVQHDIWGNDIRAKVIESRDYIYAQEIDADVVKAEGDIIARKCLAVENLAISGSNIICGETVYGAGKVAANMVITGDDIDLDGGKDAVVNPNVYKPDAEANPHSEECLSKKPNATHDFAAANDWAGYLDWLSERSVYSLEKERFKLWKETISVADGLVRRNIAQLRDLTLFIWITGIASSDYFSNWASVKNIQSAMDNHFSAVVSAGESSINCELKSYTELIQALDVLDRYGGKMNENVFNIAFQMLMSNFGLKSKFVTERFNNKGWKKHS